MIFKVTIFFSVLQLLIISIKDINGQEEHPTQQSYQQQQQQQQQQLQDVRQPFQNAEFLNSNVHFTAAELSPQTYKLVASEYPNHFAAQSLDDDQKSQQLQQQHEQQQQQQQLPLGVSQQQDPMRRRRRKRKRRPQQQQQKQQQQQQQQQLQNQEFNQDQPQPTDQTYWSAVPPAGGGDVDGQLILSSINSNGNSGGGGGGDDDESAQQSRQVENVRIPYNNKNRSSSSNRAYRRPYSLAKKEEEEQSVQINSDGNNGGGGSGVGGGISGGAIELKNLLKKNGGLSLSEILQQQNLSLDDLLKGKQNALKVLQNPTAPSEPTSGYENQKESSFKFDNNNRRNPFTGESDEPVTNRPRRLPNYQNKLKTSAALSTVESPQIDNNNNNDDVVQILGTLSSFIDPQTVNVLPNEPSVEPITANISIDELLANIETTNVPQEQSFGNNNNNNNNRRIPQSSSTAGPVVASELLRITKPPIKEIVSGIRPDLHNTSTRKRLVPVKIRPSPQSINKDVVNVITSAVSSTQRPKSLISNLDNIRERLPPRWGNGHRLRSTPPTLINTNDTVTDDGGDDFDFSISTTPFSKIKTATTEEMSIVSITPPSSSVALKSSDTFKDIVKNRLTLRPRLRSQSTTLKKTTTTTTTTIRPPMTTDLIDSEYTTIFPLQNDEEQEILAVTTMQSLIIKSQMEQTNQNEVNGRRLLIPTTNRDDEADTAAVADEEEEPNLEINAIEQLPAEFEEFSIKIAADSDIENLEKLFSQQDNGRDVAHAGDDDDDDTAQQESITSRSDNLEPNLVEHIFDKSLRKKNAAKKLDVTERNPSLFTDITSAKTIDDRTDILELLEDRRTGARLYKVLAQRNMSLSELLEHRKRGSSQLHLAEIFHNKTGQPVEGTILISKPPSATIPISVLPSPSGKSLAMGEKLDIVTAFENFPTFNLGNVKSVKPDDIKTDSQGSSYFTSIIKIKPTDEVYTESDDGDDMKNNPTIILSTEKSTDFYHPWSYGSQDDNYVDSTTNRKSIVLLSPAASQTQPPPPPPPLTPQIKSLEPLQPLQKNFNNIYKDNEQIENELTRSHDILDNELSGYGYKRRIINGGNNGADEIDSISGLPVGVRSAIIASSSIVGISLFIFIIIFATCRWRQRRKKVFNYAENFQAVRSRLPILTASGNGSSNSSSAVGGGSSGVGSSGDSSGTSSKRSTSPPAIVYSTGMSHGRGGSVIDNSTAGQLARDLRNSKINTMDPNSPEVQEYLYDAMRKPYHHHHHH